MMSHVNGVVLAHGPHVFLEEELRVVVGIKLPGPVARA